MKKTHSMGSIVSKKASELNWRAMLASSISPFSKEGTLYGEGAWPFTTGCARVLVLD